MMKERIRKDLKIMSLNEKLINRRKSEEDILTELRTTEYPKWCTTANEGGNDLSVDLGSAGRKKSVTIHYDYTKRKKMKTIEVKN